MREEPRMLTRDWELNRQTQKGPPDWAAPLTPDA